MSVPTIFLRSRSYIVACYLLTANRNCSHDPIHLSFLQPSRGGLAGASFFTCFKLGCLSLTVLFAEMSCRHLQLSPGRPNMLNIQAELLKMTSACKLPQSSLDGNAAGLKWGWYQHRQEEMGRSLSISHEQGAQSVRALPA